MPLDHPLLKLPWVITFHELEATIEVRLDPAPDVFQIIRHHPPMLSEATVNSESISVLESLDHHEEHDVSLLPLVHVNLYCVSYLSVDIRVPFSNRRFWFSPFPRLLGRVRIPDSLEIRMNRGMSETTKSVQAGWIPAQSQLVTRLATGHDWVGIVLG
jgi:hypothetical protein